MPTFKSIHYSGGSGSPNQARLRTLDRSTPRAAGAGPSPEVAAKVARTGDEAMSRLYLQTFLEDAGSETLLEITSPASPQVIPDMLLASTAPVPAIGANTVVFQQSAQNIPIFGGRVVVDIDSSDKSLVSINGRVTPYPTGISPVATLSAGDAFARLASWGNQDKSWVQNTLPSLRPPVLTWFLDEETEKWHLVLHFASVPMTPKATDTVQVVKQFSGLASHCLDCSPRSEHAPYDYFVDAHDGAIVFYFSSTPHMDVPAPMQGVDSNGTVQKFFGLNGGTHFLLMDPLRNIETFDFGNGDLDANPPLPFPAGAIRNTSNDFTNSFPAAVSAHYHARIVFDFFNDVLKRDGVDDKGMKLVSVVNVYSSNQNPLPPPQWRNAVWWQQKMWYGQVNGTSLAKHLDVIAHELTHGVTETSSKLIYRRLSGALNESYSDIFGVIIANWYPGAPQSISTWNWKIGAGLGAGGGPIRDFANPASTGQPDNFSQYVVLPLQQDNGGVHIYSGIHNKAIHLLLTGTASGQPTFPVAEAALLLYLTLTRLTPTSDFHDSRRTLESVVRSYHASDPSTMTTRLNAIASAFGAVGL